MYYYIFRKIDSVLLYRANSEKQYANEKVACLQNEGGAENDYIYLTSDIDIPRGYIPTINEAQNEVIAIENPIRVARRQAHESANAKLTALGFTDEEIKAFRE